MSSQIDRLLRVPIHRATYQALKKRAADEGRSMADIVRQAIVAYLTPPDTPPRLPYHMDWGGARPGVVRRRRK